MTPPTTTTSRATTCSAWPSANRTSIRYAVNPSGSYGLFQFIRSTWKSTPYGDEDVFDPEANANAAAWMWSEGRKSEWVCQ